MRTIVIAVVALLVGAAVGAGWGMMQVDEVTQKLVVTTQEKDQAQQNAVRLRRTIDEATRKYGNELGRMVTVAAALPAPPAAAATVQAQPPAAAAPAAAPVPAPATDEAAKLLDHARAILAARDGFRASLDTVRAAMNSEFDALATELGSPTPDADKVKQTFDVLRQNWPNKEKGLDEATRRLMADLGLLQAARPDATPAPVPAPAPAEKK